MAGGEKTVMAIFEHAKNLVLTCNIAEHEVAMCFADKEVYMYSFPYEDKNQSLRIYDFSK